MAKTATKKPARQIDLKPFCDTEPSRYAITEPWRFFDVVYATDGRILIEVKAEHAKGVPEPSGKVPRAVEIFNLFPSVKEWGPCPKAPKSCADCNGTGRLLESCNQCGGTGLCTCRCGDEHECSKCESGSMEGAYCHNCMVQIGIQTFQAKYMRLIAALPKAECGLDASDDCRLYFRFDGGRGALMAVARDRY